MLRGSVIGAVVCAFVFAASARAHADPAGVALSVIAGGSMFGSSDLSRPPTGLSSLIGASIAWQAAPPTTPDAVGARVVTAQVVPEGTIERMGMRSMALAGARLDLDMAEHHARGHLRSDLWAAARYGWLQGADGAVAGGEWGMTFFTRADWGIGFAYGALTWREPAMTSASKSSSNDRQIALTFDLIVVRAR